MKMMSEGMQNSAGNKMRVILSNLTHNRFIAFGAGAFITTAIQSSNATCAMLVSFVNSKLMKFSQTLSVILGTAIGTTITLQIIAFKLTDYSLLIVAIGFILYLFSRKPKVKYIGEIVLGFGILFFGMYIMSEAMYPLKTYYPFINILYKLENPLFGLIIGTLFTALIQSSSAFLGIIIVLGTQGLLTLEAAIPLLLGSNIGTATTAILSSFNTSLEAKKVAVALTVIKVTGVLLIIWWMPSFTKVVELVSPKGSTGIHEMSQFAEILPRQIANAHTVFNVLISILFIPLTGQFARLIDRFLPEQVSAEDVEEKIETTYLDYNIKNTPSLGLNLAKEEALRVGRFAFDMVHQILRVFTEKDEKVILHLEKRKKQVDYLMSEIDRYLMRISRGNINDQHVNESFQIMYTVKEFDQIAEAVFKIMFKHAKTWLSGDLEFSDAGKAELDEYHSKVTKQQIGRAHV
jgi:phosphate:Na+ symporter